MATPFNGTMTVVTTAGTRQKRENSQKIKDELKKLMNTVPLQKSEDKITKEILLKRYHDSFWTLHPKGLQFIDLPKAFIVDCHKAGLNPLDIWLEGYKMQEQENEQDEETEEETEEEQDEEDEDE